MADSLLVSVVMTSYNYANYIPEAIQSVYDQTYRNIELIIVDDGSSDNSPDVIRQYTSDSPFPVKTIFKENGGQASAFNAAHEQVNGEIICYIDSDDVWRPGKVQAMVDLYHLSPDGGLYQHQVEVGFEGKRRLEYIISGDVFNGWLQIGPRLNMKFYQGRISPFVPTVGLSLRREVLEAIKPIPEAMITCPDAYLTRAAITHGPLYSHPSLLGTWREHGENAGKAGRFGYHEYWLPTIMPILNAFYKKNNFDLEFYYDPDEVSPGQVPPTQRTGHGNIDNDQEVEGSIFEKIRNYLNI